MPSARACPPQMTELNIYPFAWRPEDRDWLMTAFRDLRSFYAEAAANGWAIVTCLA
jgi:Domain of unknown function (DUF1877)